VLRVVSASATPHPNNFKITARNATSRDKSRQNAVDLREGFGTFFSSQKKYFHPQLFLEKEKYILVARSRSTIEFNS
jgi:hypothetical protein